MRIFINIFFLLFFFGSFLPFNKIYRWIEMQNEWTILIVFDNDKTMNKSIYSPFLLTSPGEIMLNILFVCSQTNPHWERFYISWKTTVWSTTKTNFLLLSMVRRWWRWCDCLNYIEWVIICSLILLLYPKAICSVLKWFIAYITIQQARTKQVIRRICAWGGNMR